MATISPAVGAPWHQRPNGQGQLPFPVFSALNLASPLTLPVFALLASSYFYVHRETNRILALSDTNFTDPLHHEVYDFIVIGAGSACAVVANRLSKHNRVLLLEAGGNPHPISIVPLSLFAMLSQPRIDWQYETEPQKFAAFGLKGQKVAWARAKSLGGCSTINGAIYMRGSPKDYENWANITGDESWNYKNLLPFFKNLEDYEGNFPSKSHGKSGPLHVEPLGFAPGLHPLIKAIQEVGYKEIDLNSYQDGEGFMATETTTQKGRRADTYRTFLRPLWRRKNLKISRFSHTFKIHLDRNKSAYGVSYVRHGITKFVRANKEIIVSAGVINSPQLLLLSGIGPKSHLNSTGIKCRVNLPVGQNLQDHVGTFIGPITVDGGHAFMLDRNLSLSAVTDYILNGTGFIALVPASVTGTISSSFADPSWPDLHMHIAALAPHYGSGPLVRVVEDAIGMKRNILADYVEATEGKDAYFNGITVGRPHSRGQITLRSKDPFDKPLIDPKYYSDPRDAEIMIDGIQKVLKIYENAPAFRKINATLANGPIRGCDEYGFGSKKYWDCYIRTFTLTLWHPCCTCPMKSLKSGTYDGVVDSKLRVLKTRNLRVIDASAMPVITNAIINMPTIMIGGKGSFMIRQHWADQFLICSQKEYFIDSAAHDRKCFYSQHV